MKRGQFILPGVFVLLFLPLASAVDFTVSDEVGDVSIPSLDIDFVDLTYNANTIDVVFHLKGENGQITNPPSGTYNFVIHMPDAATFSRVFLSFTGTMSCNYCSNPLRQGNTISFTINQAPPNAGDLIQARTETKPGGGSTQTIDQANAVVGGQSSCTENWQCASWNNCANNVQTRSCTDSNNCGTSISKPATTRSCTSETGFSCAEADFNADGVVDSSDQEEFNSHYGQTNCFSGTACEAYDLNNDGRVDLNDLSLFSNCYGESIDRACTENWQCSDWSDCVNSMQTRTCSDLNGCNIMVSKPDEVRSCEVVCVENWQCTAWSDCDVTTNTKTRTCTDANSCGTFVNRPQETELCESLSQRKPNIHDRYIDVVNDFQFLTSYEDLPPINFRPTCAEHQASLDIVAVDIMYNGDSDTTKVIFELLGDENGQIPSPPEGKYVYAAVELYPDGSIICSNNRCVNPRIEGKKIYFDYTSKLNVGARSVFVNAEGSEWLVEEGRSGTFRCEDIADIGEQHRYIDGINDVEVPDEYAGISSSLDLRSVTISWAHSKRISLSQGTGNVPAYIEGEEQPVVTVFEVVGDGEQIPLPLEGTWYYYGTTWSAFGTWGTSGYEQYHSISVRIYPDGSVFCGKTGLGCEASIDGNVITVQGTSAMFKDPPAWSRTHPYRGGDQRSGFETMRSSLVSMPNDQVLGSDHILSDVEPTECASDGYQCSNDVYVEYAGNCQNVPDNSQCPIYEQFGGRGLGGICSPIRQRKASSTLDLGCLTCDYYGPSATSAYAIVTGDIKTIDLSDNILVFHRDARDGESYQGVFLCDQNFGLACWDDTSGIYGWAHNEPTKLSLSGENPRTDGNEVVWEDDDGIHKYDISTKTQSLLISGTNLHNPVVSEGNIVWEHFRDDGFYDLYYVSAGESQKLVESGLTEPAEPAIDGTEIAWISNGDVHYCDIADGCQIISITNDEAIQKDVDIDREKIVWADDRNGDFNIYMYNLPDSQEYIVTDHATDQTSPRIDEYFVVWTDERFSVEQHADGRNYDRMIFICDLYKNPQGCEGDKETLVDRVHYGKTERYDPVISDGRFAGVLKYSGIWLIVHTGKCYSGADANEPEQCLQKGGYFCDELHETCPGNMIDGTTHCCNVPCEGGGGLLSTGGGIGDLFKRIRDWFGNIITGRVFGF